MLKTQWKKQAKEILALAQENGVKSNFLFSTTFDRYMTQLELLERLKERLKDEDLIIELLKPDYIKRLTILGGEPLIERNVEPLTALLRRVKHIYPNKKIWLYTGGNFEFESIRCDNLIEHTDVVIDGLFKQKLRDITLKWKGSSNQRVIDVQKSLKKGEVVLSKE